MGMKLMNGLSDELDGKLRISGDNGTTINIEFSTTAI
jgi:two-component sensor histidine kinase